MTKKYIHKDGRTAKVVGYDKDGKTVRGCNGYVYYKEDLLKNGFTLEAPTEEVKDWIDKAHEYFIGNYFPADGKVPFSLFRQAIENHMPKLVEQELIPLQIENIRNELWEEGCVYGDKWDKFQAVLSKYGVQEEDECITLEEAEEQIKQCTGIDTQAFPNHLCDSCGKVHGLLTSKCSGGAMSAKPTPTPQATSVDTSKVTRFEVIDDTGRVYTNMSCTAEISMQDDNKTLKVFVKGGKSHREQATSVKRCGQNHCIDPITEEVLCGKECFEATSVIDVEEAVDRIGNDLILSPTGKEMVKKHLSSLPIQKKRSKEEIEKTVESIWHTDIQYDSKIAISVMRKLGLLQD